MKNQWTFGIFFFVFAPCLHAQVYHEDFTSGSAGWTLNVLTGANSPTDSNAWQVNAAEGGVLPPGCGVESNGNPTLYIGCTSLFCGSLIIGAVYNATRTTNKRAESPDINTAGQSGLTLSFDAISAGMGLVDNASVLYNCGSGWTLLLPSIKTNVCGNGRGQWTAFTAALPSSCENNSSVRIGFNWTNDGDAVGEDPSVAIDNVLITATSPEVFANGFEAVVP